MTNPQNKKIRYEHKSIIEDLYYNKKLSLKEVSKFFGATAEALRKFMKKNNMPTRSINTSYQFRKVWSSGLTKNDPKFAAAIDKGRQTQIKNGKSKGSNNPMYGKPSKTRHGYRIDLGHYTRSSWEANFARILIYLNLNYEYEKHTFVLSTGETYTPDFYVPSKNKFYEIKGYERNNKSKNKFYEIKGYERNNKYKKFIEDYPKIKLTLIKEKFYLRILKIFRNKIKVEDGASLLTKEEINKQFIEFYYTVKRPSTRKFCKLTNISAKNLIRIYGHADLIKENRDKL